MSDADVFMFWARLYKGTPSELNIEPAIAALGVPYRFQMPFFGRPTYFADFAFPTLRVILEIDGKEHRTKAGRAKDAKRDAYFANKGWLVLHCTNEEAQYQPYETVARLLKPRILHDRFDTSDAGRGGDRDRTEGRGAADQDQAR